MRVGRKFLFYACVQAILAPRSPYDSALVRIFVATGALWYLPRGVGRVSIYDESNDDMDARINSADDVRDHEVAQDGEDDDDDATADVELAAAASGLENDEEAVVSSGRQAPAGVQSKKPTSCTVLLRDNDGTIPLLHAGQYVSVTLIRAGMYERTIGGRVRERPAPVTLDFHQHIYDVVRCSTTTTHQQIELRTLLSALAHPEPLALIEQSRQRADSAREKAKFGAPEQAVRARGAYKEPSNIYKEIIAAFDWHRSSMSWLGGLIAALPSSVRIPALLAFTPFYQAHSAAYGPYENIGAMLSKVRAPGREVCLWSAIELQCIAYYECVEYSAALTIFERLFFGALVGRVPLCEYEHAVGRWRGIYYKEPAFKARGDTARLLAQWPRTVCDVLGLEKRPLTVLARNIAYIAWAMYDASATLLSYRACLPEANTVVMIGDVSAYVIARRRYDRRFFDDALVGSAINVLLNVKVWERAPDDTEVRLAMERQRAGRASDYFNEPPSDESLAGGVLLARAYDLSKRLAESAFEEQVCFYDTHKVRADLLISGNTTFLYYSVRPAIHDCGIALVALPRLLEREREDPMVGSDFRLRVLVSNVIVLLDAHMFTEVQLLRLLVLVAEVGDEGCDVPRRVLFVGDMHICSPFASLALAAAQHPGAGRYARSQVHLDMHPLQRAIYTKIQGLLEQPPIAQQLRATAAAPPWQLVPGEAGVQRRWILVAHTYAAASSALSWLARSVVGGVEVADTSLLDIRISGLYEKLLELAQRPALFESTLLLAAPWVGYFGRCVRVLRVFAEVRPRERLDEKILESACLSIDASSLTQAVSLDADSLLLEVVPDTHAADVVDHRRCCDTWAPNVLSVAVHRAHLCAQSLPLARDALPCDNRLTSGTALLLTSDYTLDTLYAAAVRATYHPRTIVTLETPDAQPLEVALERRQPQSLNCVGDLYATLLKTLS